MQREDAETRIIVRVYGSSQSGKSNIILRACDNVFVNGYISSIGGDFKAKYVTVAHEMVHYHTRMSLYDYSHHQRSRTVNAIYRSQEKDPLLIVCNLQDFQNSFQEAEHFLQPIIENRISNSPHIIFFLNQCDAIDNNTIQQAQQTIQAKTASYQCYRNERREIPCYVVSAKTNQGMEEAFQDIAKNYLIKNGQIYSS